MTLLEIVKEFCARQGLGTPSIVVSSQDDLLLQIVALANEVLDYLVFGHDWSALTHEAVFTSVAGMDQGALSTIAPFGVHRVIGDTIYDRSRRLPIFGPRSPQAWQALKALPMAGPLYQYRFREGHLLISPDMAPDHTVAFEYMSKNCVQDNSVPLTPTGKQYFTRDDDTLLLDSSLLLLGLRWKWKEEKGFPYAEEFRRFEMAVVNAKAADGTKPILKLDSESGYSARPGILISPGNWNLP